jgi:hypothetical protein
MWPLDGMYPLQFGFAVPGLVCLRWLAMGVVVVRCMLLTQVSLCILDSMPQLALIPWLPVVRGSLTIPHQMI